MSHSFTPSPSDSGRALAARLENARVSALVTCLTAASVVVYSATTWSRPHRSALVALALGVGAGVAALLLPPVRRRLETSWGPWIMLAATIAGIAVCVAAVRLDGASSPLVLLFLLPVLFAALSFPPRAAAGVGAVAMLGCVLALAWEGRIGVGYLAVVVSSLISAGLLGIWQAHRHDRQRERLGRLSRTDYLTGCLNRRGFEEQLRILLARHARHATPFAVLLLDLDDFKAVNDRYGHVAGDGLLEWTGKAIASAVRTGEPVARLGGDEFAVLLLETGPQRASAILDRVRAVLEERTAASGGFACCPSDGRDSEALYRCADRRLYEAKRTPT